LAGCHTAGLSITDSQPTSIAGSWMAVYSVRGSSLVFGLEESGSLVHGSGTYAIEAGRQGNVTVTGSFDDPTVKLNLSFDSGQSASFVGRLTTPRIIAGSIMYTGFEPSELSFQRP
jgi:hypothetical protein